MREVILFPEYKVCYCSAVYNSFYASEVLSFKIYCILHQFDFCLQIAVNSEYNRRHTSEKLRRDLDGPNSDSICIMKRIYIDLPVPSMHSDHLMGDVCYL